MKNLSVLLLLVATYTGSAQLPQWKKEVITGSVMTGIGTGMIGAGGWMVGFSPYYLMFPDNSEDVAIGGVLAGGGALLITGGIVLDVFGPIRIARGVKRHKNGDESYLQFTPAPDMACHRFTGPPKPVTVAAVSIRF